MGQPSQPRSRAAAGAVADVPAVLRETGKLADSLDALVAFGVRAELAARGWDRDWPPLPAQAKNPGRQPGTRNSLTSALSRQRRKKAYTRSHGGKSAGMARHLIPLSTR